MAAPKDRELGVRSPFKLRAGIDFPTWEGVNRQNDPGAIRDTQFQTAVNVRLNGNEIVSRGGQTKAYVSGVTGCIYGMIDVDDEDIGLFTWDTNISFGSLGRVGLTSNVYSNLILSTEFTMSGEWDVIPFQGRLYVFGEDPVTGVSGFYVVTLGETTKWALVQELPTAVFNTYAIRQEATTGGANEAMYIGTNTTNTVYRWDGVTLTTEATGVGSGELVMFTYQGEVYAASNNSLNARGDGSYSTSYAMPGSVTSFGPASAIEYGDLALIAGTDSTVGSEITVLSFNGSVLTTTYNEASQSGSTAVGVQMTVGGGKAWFNYNSGTLFTFNTILRSYDGATWTLELVIGENDTGPGGLLALDTGLYWWPAGPGVGTPGVAGGTLMRLNDFDAASVSTLFSSPDGSAAPRYMNVLS